jgi:UDPglucose--hexose-1-phosphate uridylyltransferase
MTAPPSKGPHRRFNPLLDEWVLCSPQRLSRPWQGRTESVATAALPAYDPGCYLCPGNARVEGARNPRYETTFVFDNDFPALTLDAPEPAGRDPLLRSEPAPGICRVVCFSPRHDLTLARMEARAICGVIETWAGQVVDLEARDDIAYVQVFENRGELMGCSNPHPHGQIWATGYVPGIPARKLAAQRRYREQHGRDLLGDYLDRELADGERLIAHDDHWVALVPFWAVWPFETMLVPKRAVSALPDLTAEERLSLAELIRSLGARYDNLFSCPFPFSMGWHGRPSRQESPGSRLHAVYLPPLLRSATVRKFLVGFELTAEPQRDLTPEAAAARLRETSDRHPTT